MNQQCKVCGEPAAGFHFGAFTCEGCKSFFGRTYNNINSISECKNGGMCVINKKNRTACKACRLRKCLLVGMSKSGSRYGRRSNWFKIHCLLQEQNGNQNTTNPGTSPFGGSFLQNYLPTQTQPGSASLIFGKDGKDRTSPTQEDLALQTQLLQVAMLKQEQGRGNKSPHPEDLALQHQLRLLTSWQKPQERTQQNTTPPRDSISPSNYGYKTPVFPGSVGLKETSPPDVFRPYLPSYKRAADTPSDSGTSSVESAEHNDCRSNSALSYFKNSASPTLSEREYPPRKINATVTLTTGGYHPHHHLGLVYPPAGLVTPSVPHHSPRGGDLLLVSPSPGGLAVEQDEPIDLSIRSTKSSSEEGSLPLHSELTGKRSHCDDENDLKGEPAIKTKPLDLTLGVKRPTELPLTL